MRVAVSLGLALACWASSGSAAQGPRWWVVLQKDAAGNAHLAESSTLEWRKDGRVYFWSHLFYAYPEDGLKSALIQYSVHCAEGTIAEHRYVDYDANREEIAKGDNTGDEPRQPRPATSGQSYINFACSSDVNRGKKFMSLDTKVDPWDVGEFFSDPRQIVKD